MDSVERAFESVHAPIDVRPAGPLVVLIRPLRSLAFRLMGPFIGHQQAVNAAVADALRELTASDADERAAVLSELRHTQEAIRNLQDRVGPLENAQRSLEAPPYMKDALMASREDPLYGSTLSLAAEVVADVRDAGGEARYRVFEDAFRGSPDFIRARQRVYLDLVPRDQAVLDIGCGRGEFLQLVQEAGGTGRGVDTDDGMVAFARASGLNAEVGDGVEDLRRCDSGSLGMVFAAQVVEHLDAMQLEVLVSEAHRALAPGGRLVLETVNPHSAPALKAFWVDRTHHHPLFPEVMLLLCAQAGFDDVFVFCPNGTGDYDHDRITCGEYAIVATR